MRALNSGNIHEARLQSRQLERAERAKEYADGVRRTRRAGTVYGEDGSEM
jgi:hypothetical protein